MMYFKKEYDLIGKDWKTTVSKETDKNEDKSK